LGDSILALARRSRLPPAFCRFAALRVDFREGRRVGSTASSWKPAWPATRFASLCEPRDGFGGLGRGARFVPDLSAALRYRSAFVAIE